MSDLKLFEPNQTTPIPVEISQTPLRAMLHIIHSGCFGGVAVGANNNTWTREINGIFRPEHHTSYSSRNTFTILKGNTIYSSTLCSYTVGNTPSKWHLTSLFCCRFFVIFKLNTKQHRYAFSCDMFRPSLHPHEAYRTAPELHFSTIHSLDVWFQKLLHIATWANVLLTLYKCVPMFSNIFLTRI